LLFPIALIRDDLQSTLISANKFSQKFQTKTTWDLPLFCGVISLNRPIDGFFGG
jgi:hypothetical protein